MTKNHNAKPFGSFAPNVLRDGFRRLAHGLPATYAGRRLASLLLGPAGGRARRPRDVDIFETQKARLYPFDNICEKRVYATPQLWDLEERAALGAHIEALPHEAVYFLDVGANVGLYTLFARAVAGRAGKTLRAACIEPDPDMRARADFNLEASGARGDVRLYPYAAATRRETVKFKIEPGSRGMSRVDDTGALIVQGAPLAAIIRQETDFPRIDAMKIDIERQEAPVLKAFFAEAPHAFYPAMIILETPRPPEPALAVEICQAAGYGVSFRTRMNTVLMIDG